MAKKTPLYDAHVALGAKMQEFAGYEMPITYPKGITHEHMAVRERVGLFDVSHMGEIFLRGPEAKAQLNLLLSNSFTKLKPGRIRYTLMLNDEGTIIDDLIVYCYSEQEYLLVVNAANLEKDFEWLKNHITLNCELDNESAEYGLLALQGPKAKEVLSKVCDEDLLPEKYYSFVELDIHGISCMVSQTGYTGEFGYEVYCPDSAAQGIWDLLLKAGEEFGIEPCGLGARDTLRLEAAMPLYGHELTEEINPLEAGLQFAVKLDKDDFIGKDALVSAGEPGRVRVGLVATSKGIVREGATLFDGEKEVGFVTSGTLAPYLDKAIAMAYVEKAYAEPGQALQAQVRKRTVDVEVVELPFYSRKK